MDITELIQQLNASDENHYIEAKRGSDVEKSFYETVCAFANEPELGGGYILLGIAKDEEALFPVYKVVGVTDPDALSQKIASQCASMFNIRIRPRIETYVTKGKTVIGVFIPELFPTEKPAFLKNLGLPRGAFRRIGSTDQSCTDEDLVIFYGDRKGESYDTTPVTGASMNDIDSDEIDFYRQLRKKVNSSAEELSWDDHNLLIAFSCIKEVDGQWQPTVAGILLFGTRHALRRLFPMMRVDYIRVTGKEWIESPTDRFSTVDMRGPLLSLVQRVQNAVADDLPKGFMLPEGEVQAQSLGLSTRVLREAIVNALMHRSYRMHEPLQVIRYSNRIEIYNPGYSLKAEERLGEPGSQNRNPNIAEVFHETNLAETKGSGIKTMRRLMQEANFAPPTFESNRKDDKFTTRLLLQHFLDPADLVWLSKFEDFELNQHQKTALIFVRETGRINNPNYRQINGVDTLPASKDLRAMCLLGLLEMKGKSTATYYESGLVFQQIEGEQISATKGARTPSQGISDSLQGGSASLQGGSASLQGGSNPSLGDIMPSSIDDKYGPLIAGVFSELNINAASRIDKIRASSRSKASDIRDAILILCSIQPLTTLQLSVILNRSNSVLQTYHLTPLVSSGKLRYSIPEISFHPKQAYITVDKTS
jgi:ATP-dependent DNA helicase RecG